MITEPTKGHLDQISGYLTKRWLDARLDHSNMNAREIAALHEVIGAVGLPAKFEKAFSSLLSIEVQR